MDNQAFYQGVSKKFYCDESEVHKQLGMAGAKIG